MLSADEIMEERSVEHLRIEVLAPSGWVRVTHVCKTVPMRVWLVRTASHTLRCAGQHLIRTTDGRFSRADLLAPGVFVDTCSGAEPVISASDTGVEESLFDLRVDSPDHVYYTDGIASHNSTGIGTSEFFKLNTIPNYHTLYMAPLPDHVKTFADRLMAIQRGSLFTPDYIQAKGYKANLYSKTTPKGGSMMMKHVLTDPTKIRGGSYRTCVVDEAQHFDSEFLPEIEQVQKSFRETRMTVFAGTSLDLDTCLEQQYNMGSQGVWHVRCSCKDRFHSLADVELIPKLMSVDGIRCPHLGHLLNPMDGEFVHGNRAMLDLNRVSFHLPQLIVPEYASGVAFTDIWKDFKKYQFKKFLQEVMGIAVDTGVSELTSADLQACCSDKTFDQIQSDYLKGKVRYQYVFSGCDWGGSDWNPATNTKQSYTVHTIYGLTGDGIMELIYAHRYAGANYRDIAGTIVAAHNKFKAFAMGADNGGGQYYNAYMRDCGRIPTNRIIAFNYSDTKLMLSRIDHPEANVMSLHRTDSISALIQDIKDKKLRFPRWDESQGFILDCLNMRRNITETASGKSVMRYFRHAAKADDFMQSTNYACMMKRITIHEPTVPNRQLLVELASMLGTAAIDINPYTDMGAWGGGVISG